MEDRDRTCGEARRERAARLFAAGASRAEVARTLNVCRATATRWYRVFQSGGGEALAAPKPRGRRPKLEPRELASVQEAVDGPPRARGYDLDRWSLAAISAEIRRTTGVTYHPRHVKRVLRRLGWLVPPVGPFARHAFRVHRLADPDGNEIVLRQPWRDS